MENNSTMNAPVMTPECGRNPVLAMARVPVQTWSATYDPDVALARGTIFPNLDLPFIGKEVR